MSNLGSDTNYLSSSPLPSHNNILIILLLTLTTRECYPCLTLLCPARHKADWPRLVESIFDWSSIQFDALMHVVVTWGLHAKPY